jgi:aminoglycoside phosphotransferase (APT) family kinase protein
MTGSHDAADPRLTAGKMHADETPTNAALVHNLIAAQFPQWSALPIRPVPSAGTDNALYRLGDELSVRLPRIPSAVQQVAKDHTWLPKLAPHLPLAVPEPLAVGEPGAGYPWQWAIHRWIRGENADLDRLTSVRQAALDLASFIVALHGIDTPAAPIPNAENSWRGRPLAERDEYNRATLQDLPDLVNSVDVSAAAAVWETALNAPRYSGPPRWIHGDLHAANLLCTYGRLSAVIDFGCLGVGDPACDIMTAWVYLPAQVRTAFRTARAVDDATWLRARGWALSFGLLALPYYVHTNPALATIARRAIRECIHDWRAEEHS